MGCLVDLLKLDADDGLPVDDSLKAYLALTESKRNAPLSSEHKTAVMAVSAILETRGLWLDELDETAAGIVEDGDGDGAGLGRFHGEVYTELAETIAIGVDVINFERGGVDTLSSCPYYFGHPPQ